MSSHSTAGTNGTWIDRSTGGLWSNPANWLGGKIADGTDAVADFSTLNITTSNTVHLDSARTVGTLKFGNGLGEITWTIDNNGNSGDILTLAASSGIPSIQVNDQELATIGAVMAGNEGLTKTGGGTLTLSAANTITGTTTINLGTISLTDPNALQNSTVVPIVNSAFSRGMLAYQAGFSATYTFGGIAGSGVLDLPSNPNANPVLQIGANNADTTFSGTFAGFSGTITKIGTGTLTMSTNNLGSPINSSIAISAGAIQAGSTSGLDVSLVSTNIDGSLRFSPSIGTFYVGGLSGTINLPLSDVNGAPITLGIAYGNCSGVLSGNGSLILGAAQNIRNDVPVILSGANTLTGMTTAINLQLNNANALQTSTVSVTHNPPGTTNNALMFGPNIGTFTLGGLTGQGDTSLNDTAGKPVMLRVGNNNANTTFAGLISGGGSLVKIGSGTLTISSFDGVPTTVNAGILDVTGGTANGNSGTTFVSAGTDFSAASLVRRVQPGHSYRGLGSTAAGNMTALIGSAADIRAGQDNNASFNDVAMQWRVGNANDSPRLVSDVLNLTGMSASTGSHVQTDPFVLQMTYSPLALNGDESTLAADGLIDLAWLNAGVNQPNGLWQIATAGNFGTGMPGDVFQNVQSSWDAFAAANSVTDSNVGNFLGSYGIDVAHHAVWAVVNHNSQFAIVPEPTAVVLIALGSLALCGFEVTRRMSVRCRARL